MMSTSALHALATHHGIATTYRDTLSRTQEVSDETLWAVLRAIGVDTRSAATPDTAQPNTIPVAHAGTLDLPFPEATEWSVTLEDGTLQEGRCEGQLSITDLPVGLHELSVSTASGTWRSPLPAPPPRAPSVTEMTGNARHWGIAAPVYGLEGPCGLGTYKALGDLAAVTGSLGASYVLINPVHALSPQMPEAFSPYSPSHRRFFNISHIDPAAVPEFAVSTQARQLLQASPHLQPGAVIDYPAAAQALLPVLSALYNAFADLAADHPRRLAFRAWRIERGAALERFALFEALSDRHGPSWTSWPSNLQDPDRITPDRDLENAAERHAYLQWLAETQLAEAQAKAQRGSMALGLMLDLAVGVRGDGAEVWAEPENFARGVSIGAPPDGFNPNGQNWALAPLNPSRMRTGGLTAFAETLRASMRHAGALRIDHVLGLRRNFWIADETGEGTYIAFPQEAMFAVAAIEAHRNQCLVIGEDLGNVPAGFRNELAEGGIYGCRLLYFQRAKSGAFDPPQNYKSGTMASIGSHDAPTLEEWWSGRDLSEMAETGVLSGDALKDAEVRRTDERRALLDLIKSDADITPEDLILKVHAVLAGSGSDLMTVQLEMALETGARLNLPGTTTEYPNWRRRLPPLPEILRDTRFREIVAEVCRVRAGSAA